jgi:glycosyltransferase involved in cell wall biosynthesis
MCPPPNTQIISEFVPLGYDKSRWFLDKNNHSSEINIIYVGYLESQFPLGDFIKIINRIDSVKFHVVGDGSKFQEYRDMSGENVIYHGRLEPEAVVRLCSKMHMGLLPISGSAELPNKIFDYIGSSLPILHLGKGDAKSFIEKTKFGWSFELNDLDSLYLFLKDLNISNIRKIEHKINEGKSRYTKDYLYNSFIDLILQGIK